LRTLFPRPDSNPYDPSLMVVDGWMFDIEQSPRPLIPAPQKRRTRLPLRPLPDAIAGFRGGRELRIRRSRNCSSSPGTSPSA
jgi:hypothetical protein